MKQLQPGQVHELHELHDVHVGSKDKLPNRIVVYRCIEEQKQKRLRDRAIREKKIHFYSFILNKRKVKCKRKLLRKI